MNYSTQLSKPAVFTGRVLKTIIVIFLVVDAVMKIARHPLYVKGTTDLGLPENSVQVLGAFLLVSTVLYLVRRTSVYGLFAIFSYLGGAVAITFASGQGAHPYLFPIVFASFALFAEYLINPVLRNFLSLKKY